MQFLDRLRAKPPHVRTRYALGGSFVVTAIIALVWFTTLPARLAEIGGVVPDEVIREQTASVEESFDSLFEGIQGTGEVQEVETEDPEVQQLKLNALGESDSWNGETTRSTTSAEYATTSAVSTETEVANTAAEVPKEKVILIGTTTKKSN